jgi:glycine/D-amino acid oxidase-like deaminating enzyme/nitrite reductase/ring-hydroxylating ferredoxin subunit
MRMQANPIWPVDVRRPTLEKDIRKDVVVVGGGMAGISSAVRLKRAGFDVALIERNEVGGPATGASSGVLYYGSGTNLAPAKELFGEERASSLWRETAGVIGEIIKTARDDAIDCGIRSCGSIMVAKTDAEVAELESEFAAMKKLGLPSRLLSAGDVKGYYPLTGFKGGIAYDAVGQVHPARFASGLAKLEGVEMYEQTPLLEWKEENGGVTVKTPHGVVRATDVVLATNTEPFLGLERHFELESSVILASKSTDRVDDVFPEEKIYWSMEEKYDLVYPRGDRLILELYALGDEKEKLAYYFPGVDFQVEQQWGETWAKPQDWIPMVGKVAKHVTVAIGMGDQGIIMSWLSGSKIPMLLEGKGDWFTEMASPSRFSTAPAVEGAEGSAEGFEEVAQTSELPPGKIKVMKLGDREIWVANIDGTFYAHPNKCTHAGGPVGRGKLTGAVIQCPFHGSKFDVRTGAVVGPPAKIELPSYEVRVEGTGIWVRKPN